MPTALLAMAAIASLLFTLRAVIARSWMLMWLAAFCSLAASFLGIYSIGGAIFLITCLQIAAALALSHVAPRASLPALLLSAGLVWAAVVPAQNYGPDWLGGYSIYPLVGIFALLAFLPVMASQPHHA